MPKNNLEQKKNELSKLNNDLANLGESNKKKGENLDKIQEDLNKLELKINESKNSENKESIKHLYADSINNGEFFGTSDKPGDLSIYELNIEEGTFTVRPDAEKRVIGRPGNLEGCDVDVIQGGKILIIKEAGKMHESNGKWIIDSKLKVKITNTESDKNTIHPEIKNEEGVVEIKENKSNSEYEEKVKDIEKRRQEELKKISFKEFENEFNGKTFVGHLIQIESKFKDNSFRVIGIDQEDKGIDIGVWNKDKNITNFTLPIRDKDLLSVFSKYQNVEWSDEDINTKYDKELTELKKSLNITSTELENKEEINSVENSSPVTEEHIEEENNEINTEVENEEWTEEDEKLLEEVAKTIEKIERRLKEIEKEEEDENKEKIESKNNNLETMGYLKTIQDGVFHTLSKTPEDCFFRMFNQSGNTANFEFSGDVRVAIANNDTIKEVSTYSGASIAAKDIQNIESGIVEKQNDGTWKIIKKPKIKFISTENETNNINESIEEKVKKLIASANVPPLVGERIYLKEREGDVLFKEPKNPEDGFYVLYNFNGNRASYRFSYNEDRAIGNYDAVLKNMFDQNKLSSGPENAKHIVNLKDGIVEKDANGKWKVIEKAEILLTE